MRLVEVEVRGEAEPVPQRPGQQPGPGGRADQGERRDLQRDRGGAWPLPDHDVDPEVLHRHVEHLLGGPGHPVDLVEDEHLALGEAGQDGREVTGVLDRRPAGDAQRRLHLGRDDHREGGLAQARRAAEQDVVGHPATAAGRLEHQAEAEMPEAIAAQRLRNQHAGPAEARHFRPEFAIQTTAFLAGALEKPLLINSNWNPFVAQGPFNLGRLWQVGADGKDPRRLKTFDVRFTAPVYPGDRLRCRLYLQ